MNTLNTNCGRRHLFIDLHEVDAIDYLQQRLGQARKHPDNPVLRVGLPYEWDACRASPWPSRSVVYDPRDRLFKTWYYGLSHGPDSDYYVGYAASPDGVRWIKPVLRQMEWKGSLDHNILAEPARGCSCFILDEQDPDPLQRYKAIGFGLDHKPAICHSPDGLSWHRGQPFRIANHEGRVCDSVVFLRDDQDPDPNGRWKFIWQDYGPANKPGPSSVRHKYLATGPTPGQMTFDPQINPILSPNDSREQENHFVMYFPYQGYWLCAYEHGYYLPNGGGTFGQYQADIRLAASRCPGKLTRVLPEQSLIARGTPGQWDEGFLVITQQPIILDQTIYFFYSGMGGDWTCWPPSNNPRYPDAPGPAKYARDQMGLATLRLDGFAYMQSADQQMPGSLTTQPLAVTDRRVNLFVNLDSVSPRRSWAQVQVLDARTLEPLPGHDLQDGDPLEVDSVHLPVTWKNKPLALPRDLGAIRLRFHLFGSARLYAYGFDALEGSVADLVADSSRSHG